LNLDPAFQGVHPTPPSSSKFKFFPPETIDAFAQNQWRQEPQPQEPQWRQEQQPQEPQWRQEPQPHEAQLEFSHFQPGISVDDATQYFPPAVSQPVQAFELDKGKDHASVETCQPPATELAEWEVLESDDDVEMEESDDDEMLSGKRETELGMIVAERLNARYDSFDTQPRMFGYYGDHNLAMYEPGPGNSPLNDKQIATVFWHFVNVTGPAISMFERHPFDGVSYYHGPQVKSRQHIWTCEFEKPKPCVNQIMN
jgi:hypothetical protein